MFGYSEGRTIGQGKMERAEEMKRKERSSKMNHYISRGLDF